MFGFRDSGLGFKAQASKVSGFPKIWGTNLGPNKDYSILGSILGSPYFGKLPFGFNELGLRNSF